MALIAAVRDNDVLEVRRIMRGYVAAHDLCVCA